MTMSVAVALRNQAASMCGGAPFGNAFTTHVDFLANARSLDQAKAVLSDIRYADGKPSFQSRNHFTEAQWLPANSRKGYLKDAVPGIDRFELAHSVAHGHGDLVKHGASQWGNTTRGSWRTCRAPTTSTSRRPGTPACRRSASGARGVP